MNQLQYDITKTMLAMHNSPSGIAKAFNVPTLEVIKVQRSGNFEDYKTAETTPANIQKLMRDLFGNDLLNL